MSVQSMTGFARQEGSHGDARWTWELRSVNGKSLDIRFRLPPGSEALEASLRERLAAHIKRGNIQVGLQLETAASHVIPVLNEAAFAAACGIAQKAAERTGLAAASLDAILAMRGVVEYREQEAGGGAAEARNAALLESFDRAAAALADGRRREGEAIAAVLGAQIAQIEDLTRAVAADPSRSADAIRARLAAQIERLIEAGSSLEEHRLHQEAALLATKADLQEEIDRLLAHVGAARELIAGGGAIGRELDFLSQEFNRECNTICSKSNAVAVTAHGLEMKVIIDRFREQVQNIQ